MLPEIFVSAGNEFCTYAKNVPAPIFRKSIKIDKPSVAKLIIGATGFYDLFLNGEKITNGYLAPFITNPDEVIFYNEYEINLKKGENVIGVMLGNGFCNPIGAVVWQHDRHGKVPSFALEFECGDLKFSAKDMKWKYSHILFDDLRCGTYCDMTKESTGWSNTGYDETDWEIPTLQNYTQSEKRLVQCEPVKEIRSIKAVEILKGELRDTKREGGFKARFNDYKTIMEKSPLSGGYIYDFGENNAGVPKLKIRGRRGQKIEMQFSELMLEGFVDCVNVDVYPDGCCQRDVYICSGEGEEIYIPPFTYHGFRYCYISGIDDEQATEDLLTYVVLHNDVEEKGSFCCSDEISNQIFNACRRSQESNLFYILTDCPQREKNGWTGDAAISAEHYILNLGIENCMADWLCCIRASQKENGGLPLVVPSHYDPSNSPVWDSVLFYLPYYLYVYTGDIKYLEENVNAMLSNLDFSFGLCDERGIIESGMGDWLPVDKKPAEYASPLGFCASAVLLDMCNICAFACKKLNMENEAKECEKKSQRLRNAIRNEYNENGVIVPAKSGKNRQPTNRICQTSQVLGLWMGIFNEEEKGLALKKLIELIKEKSNSFDCGFLGLRWIFHVLSDNGYSDLAYEMITRPEHPSYANLIYRGETTMCESFKKPGRSVGSHNHHFMADVASWYIKSVAGINVNPQKNNSDEVLIKPNFIDKLDWVKASYKTPGGKVGIKWERQDNKIRLEIKTQGNTKVIVHEDIKNVEIVWG